MLTVPSVVTNLCVGRLAGGDGRLPRTADRERPFLDIVLRRALMEMGSGIALSPDSCWRAAVRAATLAPVFVMLFRRVTRWLLLKDPESKEWELVRECGCRAIVRAGVGLEDTEGRCERGREVCCISWKNSRDHQ